MVLRLNSEQTRQIVRDCVPLGFTQLRYPEPVSAEAIEQTATAIAGSEIGRCYGLFTDRLEPRGLFAGLIMADPLTGVPIGLEQLWWCASGSNGMPLLERFESDCKEAGCKRVIMGWSEYVNPKVMARMYRQRGYKPFSVSVAKEL